MFRLTSIELENFGRHRRISQALEGNVIGLTGHNGLGKSTVLQAIQYACTGTIDHPDPLKEFIRKGSAGGVAKSAFVKLGFSADGRKGSITRKITNSATSRELILEGLDGPVSSDKRVTEIMFELLGVDKKAMSSTVFIKQGAIAEMFGDATERRDFYGRLLMLGHLPKIADVVEGYRKNTASSIVDLASVLDEAQNAQRDATSAFEELEHRLKGMRDYTAMIQVVSRLVFLFGEQTSAHENLLSAAARAGDNTAARLEQIKGFLQKAQERRSVISTKRLDYAFAESKHATAMSDLRAAEVVVELHQQLRDMSKKVEEAKIIRDSNRESAFEVIKWRKKLDALDVIQANRAAESSLEFDLALLNGQLEEAESALAMASLDTQTHDTHLMKCQNELTMRRNLLNEIKRAHDCTQCLVCGSGVSETSFLENAVAQWVNTVEHASTVANAATAKYLACHASVTDFRTKRDEVSRKFAAVSERMGAAWEALENQQPSRDEVTVTLEHHKLLETAFINATADVIRLQTEMVTIHSKLNGLPDPDEATLSNLRLLVHTRAAERMTWDAALDEEDTKLWRDIGSWELDVTNLTQAVNQVASARERLSRAETELSSVCNDLPNTLPDTIFPRGSVVTAALAGEMLANLQAAQSEYDQTKGSRETARDAMTVAQRRVIDTELRIENQQTRIALVDRLTRLRDAFKPTGVSLDYLDYKFNQVAMLASDYLAESGADFSVVASETTPLAYDFIRMQPGEEWLTQSRLSGGQKVRLAVATLRAIHSLVVPNVGLLVLDEPTTHLDHEAKMAMAEMLRRIGNEGGLQMIVCDHEPILIDAFSSTIDIPE